MSGYTDAQKAIACDIIRKNDGSVSNECLEKIRETLGEPKLPRATVNRWWVRFKSVAINKAIINLPENKTALDGANALSNFLTSEIRINAEEIAEYRERNGAEVPLDLKLERAAHKFMDHAMQDELMMWTNSKDAIIAASIAIDKMRLLREMPPEIAKLLPDLTQAFQRHGDRFLLVISKVLQRLNSEADSAPVPVQHEYPLNQSGVFVSGVRNEQS
jgi:hypothetical protein